ncbi:hypothetical protein [Novosphingobium sp.]|uniref:hypothetical protein n=1 Tax=Novosphingobium sp. TaxID=1874826 RepID=UPI0038B936E3
MAIKTIRHMLTAFNAGELSPFLFGRVDSQQYAVGLHTCENFVPVNEGPLIKRPGFELIRDADASASWLGAFRFSISQEYVLEFAEAKIRFYTNGGRIESSPVAPYEVITPYTAAEAPKLSMQQSYDRLYIDHAAHPPGRLNRTGAVTFTYDVSPLKNGPFADGNSDETITVTASATTGAGITLTASSAIFRAGHVGSFFRLEAKDFSDVKAWEPGMKAIAVNDYRRSDGKVYQAASAGITGTIAPTHTDGSEWDGSNSQDVNNNGPYGVKWTYIHDRFGIVKITAIGGGGTTATVDIIRRLPNSLTSVASWRWSYSVFSNDAGWPSIVKHWAGRQVHIKDFDLCASVVEDYLNHQAFTSSGLLAADMAFRRRLAAEDPPLWALADRELLLGTATKELIVRPVNTAAAISGTNVKSDPQSFYGSQQVTPVQLGTESMFVERGARRIRSTSYDFGSDRYVPLDLTATARHITSSGIVQLAMQRWPWPMLHAVRTDGQLAVHSLTRADIKGFARTVLGGDAKALSAVNVIGADGVTDELWLLVSRSTPAGPRREIWKQTAWRELGDDQAEAFYVDAGVRIDAAGNQNVFTGLVHLAGQSVAVLANGAVIPDLTVAADGSLTLPQANVPRGAYTLIVGLPYSAVAVTLNPAPQTNGQIQSLRQRVVKMAVRILETIGLRAGAADREPYDVQDRPRSAAMDQAIPLYSGDVTVEVDDDPNNEGRVRLVSSDPLPAVISMATFKIDVGEG